MELQWQSLCEILGHTELSDDPRFDNSIKRKQNEEDLDILIGSFTKTIDDMSLMEKLQNAGIAAGAALPLDKFWDNKQLRYRNFFETYQEETGDNVSTELPTIPWLLNGKREVNITGQPTRGQHNDYVFKEILGFSKDEVEILTDGKAIF